jgi:hypothetical protein
MEKTNDNEGWMNFEAEGRLKITPAQDNLESVLGKLIKEKTSCLIKPKRWNKENIKHQRREQVKATENIFNTLRKRSTGANKFKCFKAILLAEIKWGKREVVIISALLYPQFKHIFISALNRVDCKKQHEELESYDISCFTVTVKKDREEILKLLEYEQSSSRNNLIVHFDESDYGTGSKQKMEEVHGACVSIAKGIIHYSATNEEALFSPSMAKDEMTYRVNVEKVETYRGVDWFLDNDLVYEAKPFINDAGGLSFSGEEIINEFFNQNDKLILLVRLAGKNREETGKSKEKFLSDFQRASAISSNLRKQLTKKGILSEFVDGNMTRPDLWENIHKPATTGDKMHLVIFINQTLTRSAELSLDFLKNLYGLHDFRKSGTAYNTIIQAFRICHYDSSGFNIKVWTCIESLMIYAAPNNLKDWVNYAYNTGRKVSQRITSGNSLVLSTEGFTIINCKTVEELINEAKKRKYTVTKTRIERYKQGDFSEVKRGLRPLLYSKEQIMNDKFFGLSKKPIDKEKPELGCESSHRICAYDGGFLLIIHNGTTRKTTGLTSSTKSLYS